MINPILVECINKLSALKFSLMDAGENTATGDGINSANASIKESIDTRISLLTDIYSNTDQKSTYTNSNYATFCLEFVDSLEEVFNDLTEDLEENEFNIAYKQQIGVFLKLLQPIQMWLRGITI